MLAEELKVLSAFRDGGILSPLLIMKSGFNHKSGTKPAKNSMTIPMAVSFFIIKNLSGNLIQFYACNLYKNIVFCIKKKKS